MEFGLRRHSMGKRKAAVKTEISARVMAVGASIVDNMQGGSGRERWGALVSLESRGTKDGVKRAVCGGLLSEIEERKKRGRKVGVGLVRAKVKEEGETWSSDVWGSRGDTPWRERRPAAREGSGATGAAM
jgi:hypothetical protein